MKKDSYSKTENRDSKSTNKDSSSDHKKVNKELDLTNNFATDYYTIFR
ncbi:MAG: hypothetical protein GX053_07615 [Tissierella sp.]|nr:hypothetical protein [Tissierella sp.]